MNTYDMLMKVVIVGDSGVGKSCVIHKYCDDEFTHLTMSTIGVDFRINLVEHNNKMIKLQLWDTAGQERFRSLTGNYYKMSDAVILTYDCTDMESMKSLQETWLPEVRRLAPQSLEENHNILVLGTKSDLGADPEVTACAEQLARSIGCPHALCSSLTGEGIEDAIEEFVHQVAGSESFREHVRRRSMPTVEDETLGKCGATSNRAFGFGNCFERMFEQIRCFHSAAVH